MDSTDEQLLQYMERSWGYGCWSASYWFVGMEEGGGGSWESFREVLQAWVDKGAPQLTQLRPPETQVSSNQWFGANARIQPYWGKLIRVLLAGQGRSCDRDSVRNYQRTELATPWGDTCLLELLPLPSPSTSRWIYSAHSHLDVLRDRTTYRSQLAPQRARALRALIDAHQPRYVVFFGLTDREYWNIVARADLPIHPDRPLTLATGRTRMIVSCHPNRHGVTNAYFEQLGRALRPWDEITLPFLPKRALPSRESLV